MLIVKKHVFIQTVLPHFYGIALAGRFMDSRKIAYIFG